MRALRIPYVFLGLALLPSSLFGQGAWNWAPTTMTGYGGLGCGAGILVAKEARRNGELGGRTALAAGSVILGCVGGLRVGWTLGKKVDEFLARGEEVPTGMRRGVQLGTVLAGASVGALISLLPASLQDHRQGEIIPWYTLGGAVLGGLTQIMLNGRLYAKKSPPAMAVSVGPTGGVSVSTRFRF